MDKREVVVRLFVTPGQKYWAYTPLRSGKYVVMYAALGKPPTFREVDEVSESKKIRNGYDPQGDILLCELDDHIGGLSDRQYDAMMSNAEAYEMLHYVADIKNWKWQEPLEESRPVPPKALPKIVVDPSASQYVW